MSFIDLWDCFGEVRENWNENRHLLEAFLDVLKFLLEIEKKHCQKLDKLCTHPFFKMGKNTLVPTIEKFQKFYMVKLLNSKNFITMLQNNLIQPFKELIVNQEILIKEKTENTKKLETEKKKIEKQCEISKEKYWKACRDTLLTNRNKQEFLQKEEQCYDVYINHIDCANRYSVLFVEEMGKNLILFQISEEERLKYLRESLKKLFEAEESNLRLTLNELETIPIVIYKKAIDVFNPITELSKFIDDTKSGDSLKMITFEPSPYGTSFKIPEQKISIQDMVLLKINIKCWESISLNEDDLSQYYQIIQTFEGRKSWIYYLNERRIKAQFQIPSSGFLCLAKLMHGFLDNLDKSNDEYSAKMAIVLSQTFFEERGKEKVYLYSKLTSHKLWERDDIWVKMIENGISKEMENYAQFCMDESSEVHKERMLAILMSQLSSYIHIMKTFHISNAFTGSIIKFLADKYKLPELFTLDSLDQ